MPQPMPLTLFEKIWRQHVVVVDENAVVIASHDQGQIFRALPHAAEVDEREEAEHHEDHADAGDAFPGPAGSGKKAPPRTPRGWERSNWKGRHMQMSLLDIDIPVICAVNGPALKHGDLIFLCDIILAAEHTTFQDSHLYCDTVPGDGAHVIYPMVMGINRARYFLLTSEVINAKQALDMGMINEILPKDKLMARAWELAELLAKKPPLATRFARYLLVHEMRKKMLEMQGYGLALEGLANMDENPAPILERDFPGPSTVPLRTGKPLD